MRALAQVKAIERARCLPSGNAAIRLANGDMGAVGPVLATMALRGAAIAVGIAAAGGRGPTLWRHTLGATLSTELGVLLWAHAMGGER